MITGGSNPLIGADSRVSVAQLLRGSGAVATNRSVEEGTALDYGDNAKIDGKLAQLGGRITDGLAKRWRETFSRPSKQGRIVMSEASRVPSGTAAR